ncbi:MAG: exopolyphosphatase [Actinobacteria bacterium]|nr:exopolyphosphatase [Actinomycetota bacterium]
MRVAAIDIGTNSTRLLLADVADGRVAEIERRVTVTGLGRGVDAAGVLSEEGIAATVEVLGEYGEAIEAAGAWRRRACATSATRDAANAGAFLGRAAAALGFRPDVIEGATEARLGFAGAVLGVAGRPAPYLMIDPGGGSTEFVYGTDRPESVHSVDIGSVRLTERALPDRPADQAAILAAAGAAGALFGAVALPGEPATVIGVGGTYTSLAAIALGLPAYDRAAVHGTVLTLDALGRLVETLAGLTVAETAAIPSLDPARAPVILGGAVVAEAALRRSGRSEITVSETDILDGIALSLAG